MIATRTERSFGGQQEWIVRLAARVNLELELGVVLGEAGEEEPSSGSSAPVISVSTSRGSASSWSTTEDATASKVVPPAIASPSTRPR